MLTQLTQNAYTPLEQLLAKLLSCHSLPLVWRARKNATRISLRLYASFKLSTFSFSAIIKQERIYIYRYSVFSAVFHFIKLNCSLASLQIHDGSSAKRKHLGKFCRSKSPGKIVSSSNMVIVRFKTGASRNIASGFSLYYFSKQPGRPSTVGSYINRI